MLARQENRRTTWCPAPGGGARGPLFALSTNQHLKPLSGFGKPLASPAPLLEESLVEETDDAAEPGPAALPAMGERVHSSATGLADPLKGHHC